MKALNLTTLILVIVGGLNWGLVGAFQFNLVTAIFGSWPFLVATIYVLVGLSALWQIVPLVKAFRADEPLAEGRPHVT